MTLKSSASLSGPKIPPGSFRKNFFRTDAMVLTEKLWMLTSLPCCRKWINFFMFPWWPGARNTSFLKGPSLFNFNNMTCRKSQSRYYIGMFRDCSLVFILSTFRLSHSSDTLPCRIVPPRVCIRTNVGTPTLVFLFSPRFSIFPTLGYYSAYIALIFIVHYSIQWKLDLADTELAKNLNLKDISSENLHYNF